MSQRGEAGKKPRAQCRELNQGFRGTSRDVLGKGQSLSCHSPPTRAEPGAFQGGAHGTAPLPYGVHWEPEEEKWEHRPATCGTSRKQKWAFSEFTRDEMCVITPAHLIPDPFSSSKGMDRTVMQHTGP